MGDLEASIDRKRAALATPKKPGEEETEDLASPAPGSDDDYSEDLCVGATLLFLLYGCFPPSSLILCV